MVRKESKNNVFNEIKYVKFNTLYEFYKNIGSHEIKIAKVQFLL